MMSYVYACVYLKVAKEERQIVANPFGPHEPPAASDEHRTEPRVGGEMVEGQALQSAKEWYRKYLQIGAARAARGISRHVL